MLLQEIQQLYQKLRLGNYRRMFRTIQERKGSLSATEAFSADVIYLLNHPTVGQFAQVIGISQPNATYKVNSLVSKGYVVKLTPEGDRREVRLAVGDKFKQYLQERSHSLERAVAVLQQTYSQQELSLSARVLSSLLEAIEQEDEREHGHL